MLLTMQPKGQGRLDLVHEDPHLADFCSKAHGRAHWGRWYGKDLQDEPLWPRILRVKAQEDGVGIRDALEDLQDLRKGTESTLD